MFLLKTNERVVTRLCDHIWRYFVALEQHTLKNFVHFERDDLVFCVILSLLWQKLNVLGQIFVVVNT